MASRSTRPNVYATDNIDHTVRKIAPDGSVSTVLGVSGVSSVVLGGSPLVNMPWGIVMLDATRFAVTTENAVLVMTLP